MVTEGTRRVYIKDRGWTRVDRRLFRARLYLARLSQRPSRGGCQSSRWTSYRSHRHFTGSSHPKVAELAARLVKMTAVPMDRVMFQCSGSEANDAMIKFLWYRNIARGQPAAAQVDFALEGLLRQHCRCGQLVGPTAYARQLRAADGRLPQVVDPELLPLPYRWRKRGRVFGAHGAGIRSPGAGESGPDTIAAFFAEPMQSGGGAILPPKWILGSHAGGHPQIRHPFSISTKWCAASAVPVTGGAPRPLGCSRIRLPVRRR